MATAPPVETIKGLVTGDSINKVRVLTPTANENHSFTLRPSQANGAEDLCLIYSPEESQILMQAVPQQAGGEEASGFLLTALDGKILLSFVLFDAQTKNVLKVVPGKMLPSGDQPLFAYGGTNPDQGFAVSVDVNPTSQTNGEVIVAFKPFSGSVPVPPGSAV